MAGEGWGSGWYGQVNRIEHPKYLNKRREERCARVGSILTHRGAHGFPDTIPSIWDMRAAAARTVERGTMFTSPRRSRQETK